MKLLILFFLLTFSFYFFPFYKRVWFHHDDFDFLVGNIKFSLNYLLSPHNEHFLPFFKLFYYLEFSLFGLNFKPYFIISLVLHLLILFLLCLIVRQLTKDKFFAWVAVCLAAVNSTFYEVLLWSTGQQLLLCSLFISCAFYFWLKYHQQGKDKYLLLSGLSAFLASLSFGIGILYAVFLAFLSFWDKKFDKKGKVFFSTLGIIIIIIFLLNAYQNLTVVTKQNFSLFLLPKIFFFLFIGIFEGMLSRFFYAPFNPSRSAGTDLILMPILNLFIFLFLLILFLPSLKKKNTLFIKFTLLANFIYPYLIISLNRYHLGAKGAMAERYVYLPLFFFILFLIVQLNDLKQKYLVKIFSFVFVFYILASHSIFFYKRALLWTQQPLRNKEFMFKLREKNGQLDAKCKIPKYIKDKEEPCSKYIPLLKEKKI